MKKTFLSVCISLLLVCAFCFSSFAAMLGDVDGDGKVMAADARLALRASVGLEKYAAGSDAFYAANVDGDDKITAGDARLILRAAVGLEKITQPEPAHVHSFGAWTADKTGVLVNGNHTRVCTSCGAKETAACSYGAAKEIRAASCTSANVMAQICSVCGGQKTAKSTVAAFGHDKIPQPDKTKAATCTARGENVYLCKTCGKNVIEYVSALGHKFTAGDKKDASTLISAATCTTDAKYYYSCANCGVSAKDIDKTKSYVDTGSALGHDYTVKGNVFGENVHGLICSRCNAADTTAAGFNQLVNALKTNDYANAMLSEGSVAFAHTVSYLTKTSMVSGCKNIDFGIYTAAVKKLFEEEMTGEDLTYSPVYKNRHLSNLPIPSNTLNADGIVSEITDADATIKVEKINGLSGADVLSSYKDDSYTVGSSTYDLSGYKAKNISGDILKITVTTKKENFFGTNGIKNLAATQKTSLQKLTGYDIRSDAAAFGDNYTLSEIDGNSEEGYEIRMDMTLKQITSGANVTYYFRASDLAPVAAVYNTTVHMDQDVSMEVHILLNDINGTMDPTVDTTSTQTYLFTNFFEN